MPIPLTNLPPITPMGNTGSQIERAIANWFVNLGIGDATQNHVTNDNLDRLATSNPPCNTILAISSKVIATESRIEAFQVRIESEFPGTEQPNDAKGWSWSQINLWIGKIDAAMSFQDDTQRNLDATANFITMAGRALAQVNPALTGDAAADVALAALNADMTGFTCQKVIYKGADRVKSDGQTGLYFIEHRNFEIHVVPYNSD